MSLLRLVQTFVTLAVVISSLWASASLAEEKKPSQEQRAQAAEAFKKGQVLFDSGAYLEAAAAFERAYHLAPHPSVLANIGFCYDEVGDYPRAVSAFRKYMKQPNPKTPHDTVKISRYLKKMKSKVGDLAVNCSAAICEVSVDQVPRGVTPTNIILSAGPHSATVTAAGGGPSKHYNIDVPKGGKLVLDVDLRTDSSPPPPSSAESIDVEKDHPRLRAPFWIASSVTAAGLGAITVQGVLNHQTWQRFAAGGSTDPTLKQRGERLNIGIGITIGVTAAAATTAVILAIVDLKRKQKNRGHRLSSHPSRWSNLYLGGSAFVFTF